MLKNLTLEEVLMDTFIILERSIILCRADKSPNFDRELKKTINTPSLYLSPIVRYSRSEPFWRLLFKINCMGKPRTWILELNEANHLSLYHFLSALRLNKQHRSSRRSWSWDGKPKKPLDKRKTKHSLIDYKQKDENVKKKSFCLLKYMN